MKRLISAFLAAVFVFALAVPVFSADEEISGTEVRQMSEPKSESEEKLPVGIPEPEELAASILQIDYSDGRVNPYGSYRPQCVAVVTDELAENSYLKIYNGGSKDLYYHIDANKLGTGNFLVDPEATSSKEYYASDKLIASMKLSRSSLPVAGFTYQIKSPGYGESNEQKAAAIFYVKANGTVTTKGGITLGSLKESEWLEVAVEVDLTSATVTYWVNRKEVGSEPIAAGLTKIAYFNISNGNVEAGTETFVDDVYFGYGELTDVFYMLRVDYDVSGVKTPLYYGTDFLLPEDAPYWIGTVGGVKRLLPAGARISLAAGLSFTGYSPDFELLEGAGIRVDGNHTGLRFQMAAERDSHDALTLAFGQKQVIPGILIVPTDYLADTEFTHAAILEKYGVLADVTNKRWHSDSTDTLYTAYGTLTNLLADNYARSFSARAYVKITFSDGSAYILYADYDEAKHSRSAWEVAKAAYADTAAGYTAEQRAIIKTYIDGVLALSYDGASVALAASAAGYSSPYTVGAVSVSVSGDPTTILKAVLVNGKPCAFSVEAGRIKVALPVLN